MESDADLLTRWETVKIQQANLKKRKQNTRTSLFIGSLEFTRLSIESELRERKLLADPFEENKS